MKIPLLALFAVVALASSTPLAPHKPLPRIILGEDAERREFPYMVSLIKVDYHNCGGGILSPTWIVTAAHCFNRPNDITVVAGLLDQGEDHPDNQRVTVERVIIHPRFSMPYNDIALLKLSSPLVFNDAVQPLQLPESGTNPSGEATLAGWGRISFSPSVYATRLQRLDMPIITVDECNRLFEENHVFPHRIDDSLVCTLPRVVEQSGCHGDSGSPLVQNGVVVGIVSGGDGFCGDGLPASSPNVFGRVSMHVDFIKQYVTDLA